MVQYFGREKRDQMDGKETDKRKRTERKGGREGGKRGKRW